MEKKVVIGIDVGKKGGYAVLVNGEFEETSHYEFKSLMITHNFFKDLFEKWKPEAVITGKPNRMYNIILNHAQFIGVIAMACERYNIPLAIINDCTMRADIFGKGNGMKKQLVHEKYKGETPDVSDAMMFADYVWKNQ